MGVTSLFRKLVSIMLAVCLCVSLAGGLVQNVLLVPSLAAGDTQFGKVTTNSSNLTIRSGPGTDYGSIRSLPKGYIVEIITPNYIQGWHTLSLQGTTRSEGIKSASCCVAFAPCTPGTCRSSALHDTDFMPSDSGDLKRR